MPPPLNVLITGACSPVAYSFAPFIGNGYVFGKNQLINLKLFDSPQMSQKLDSFVLELRESGYLLFRSVVFTTTVKEAFRDVKVAIMLDGHERSENDDLKELVLRNVEIFKDRAEIINLYAQRDCRFLVLSDPANTNAYVLAKFTPTINSDNFAALSQISYNRTTSLLGERLDVHPSMIKNLTIWGNQHGIVMPDVTEATIMVDGEEKLLREVLNDDEYLKGKLVQDLRNRFDKISEMKQDCPALSIAKAAADQMRDWWLGTEKGTWTNMGVMTRGGSYDVPMDLNFSMPVEICDKKWKIKGDLILHKYVKEEIKKAVEDLMDEKAKAKKILKF